MTKPRSILICRLSALGDVVLSIPVADALRARFPDARIHFLSREPWGRILRCVPSIDQVILWNGPGTALPPDAARPAGDGAGSQWDLVIDLSATGRSRRLLRAVRTRRLLRARKETFARFAFVHLRWLGGARGRISPAVDRLFSALAPLGIAREGRVPRLATDNAVRDPQRILVAPGGGRAAKLWPAQRFAEVVRALAADGKQVLLLGSGEERALLEQVAQGARRDRVEIQAGLDPALLPQHVARCACALTNDSGLLHVAEACGVPVIALFGPTHPRLGFAPLRADSQALHTGIECSPCDLHGPERCPRSHHRCLRDISTARVQRLVDELLAAASPAVRSGSVAEGARC